MKVRGPNPSPRESGDYHIYVTSGYGDPNGAIYLDEDRTLELARLDEADCDRLIKAACEIKRRVAAHRAEMAAPHGMHYIYQGTCQLCGKPADDPDALHGDPVVVPALGEGAGQGGHPYPQDGRCADPRCKHEHRSHWENAEPDGARVGCAILSCPCEHYADPQYPDVSGGGVPFPPAVAADVDAYFAPGVTR
jgi:hypothetical protein